jgi:putative transposase
LQGQFQQDAANQVWVTNITYIRTYEGWIYLTVVLDLHSRAVVGWSMRGSMETTLVLDALTMAAWRRRPKVSVIIHSDQGSQFGSDEFSRWCKENRLSPSMSRRGKCWVTAEHADAVATGIAFAGGSGAYISKHFILLRV